MIQETQKSTRARYQVNPEPKKASEKPKHIIPEQKKASVTGRYHANPEPKKALEKGR